MKPMDQLNQFPKVRLDKVLQESDVHAFTPELEKDKCHWILSFWKILTATSKYSITQEKVDGLVRYSAP